MSSYEELIHLYSTFAQSQYIFHKTDVTKHSHLYPGPSISWAKSVRYIDFHACSKNVEIFAISQTIWQRVKCCCSPVLKCFAFGWHFKLDL